MHRVVQVWLSVCIRDARTVASLAVFILAKDGVLVNENTLEQSNGMARKEGERCTQPCSLPSLSTSASFLQNCASSCSVAATCWSLSASLASGMSLM